MIDSIFSFLNSCDNFLWGYVNLSLIIMLGSYFTIKSRFYQIRKFPYVIKTFFGMLKKDSGGGERGIRPIHAFFAAVGGCIGIGNVVVICEAVKLGGPGAVFWIWVTAFLGCLLKYAEIYLGYIYRIPNNKGSYDGGPMYFLQKAFNSRIIPMIFSALLCIYGIEIVMFSVMADTVSVNWHLDHITVVFVLLVLVMGASFGGIKRAGQICSAIIPVFIILFVSMALWVIGKNYAVLPDVFRTIFVSAFTGHAAVGGFIGSTVFLTMGKGMARGCYTGDIGVGYVSVIHSESSNQCPKKQASMAVFSIVLDTFVVCTMSLLLILVTGVWQEPVSTSLLVQKALSAYFPYMNIFMPFFLVMLGYSTIISFFCVGQKCAEFLSPRYGRIVYFLYALVAFPLFTFVNIEQALIVMSISGALLLIINVSGIFKLRKEIEF